jgi:hypothetical protein
VNKQLTEEQILALASDTFGFENLEHDETDLPVDSREIIKFAKALIDAVAPCERTITQIAGVYDHQFQCVVILALSSDQMIYSSTEAGNEWIKRTGPLPQD